MTVCPPGTVTTSHSGIGCEHDLDEPLGNDPRLAAAHEQHRRVHAVERRRRGHLAVGRHDGRRARTAAASARRRRPESGATGLQRRARASRVDSQRASPRSPRRATRTTRPVASTLRGRARSAAGPTPQGRGERSCPTRSGRRAASSSASLPPKLWPTTSTRSSSRASSVSTRSASCVPRFHGGSQTDWPCPRRSGAKTWKAPRRSSARRRKRPPQLVTPCRQRSGGASAAPHSCT